MFRRPGTFIDTRQLIAVPDDLGLRLLGGNSELVEHTYRGDPVLHKRFSAAYREVVDVTALTRLVEWPARLDPVDRAWLGLHTAWPTRLTQEKGEMVGVLLPVAPPRFMTIDRKGRSSPRGLLQLSDEPTAELLCAMGRLTQLVLRLHRLGVCVGDLRLENTLVDLHPVSRILQVDCDCMVGPWGTVGPPVAPDYLRQVLPDADQSDVATDLAKVAWCVLLLLLADYSVLEIDDVRRARLATRLPVETLDFLIAATDPQTHTVVRSAAWADLSRLWIDRAPGGSLD